MTGQELLEWLQAQTEEVLGRQVSVDIGLAGAPGWTLEPQFTMYVLPEDAIAEADSNELVPTILINGEYA